MTFMNYGVITIPKGTRVTNQTACGIDENYTFIDDLSWIPPHDFEHKGVPVKQYGLIHDATYYGIQIDNSLVKTIDK